MFNTGVRRFSNTQISFKRKSRRSNSMSPLRFGNFKKLLSRAKRNKGKFKKNAILYLRCDRFQAISNLHLQCKKKGHLSMLSTRHKYTNTYKQSALVEMEHKLHHIKAVVDLEKKVQELSERAPPSAPQPSPLPASLSERAKRKRWKKALMEAKQRSSLHISNYNAGASEMSGSFLNPGKIKISTVLLCVDTKQTAGEITVDFDNPYNRTIRMFVGGSGSAEMLVERQLLVADVYPYLMSVCEIRFSCFQCREKTEFRNLRLVIFSEYARLLGITLEIIDFDVDSGLSSQSTHPCGSDICTESNLWPGMRTWLGDMGWDNGLHAVRTLITFVPFFVCVFVCMFVKLSHLFVLFI